MSPPPDLVKLSPRVKKTDFTYYSTLSTVNRHQDEPDVSRKGAKHQRSRSHTPFSLSGFGDNPYAADFTPRYDKHLQPNDKCHAQQSATQHPTNVSNVNAKKAAPTPFVQHLPPPPSSLALTHRTRRSCKVSNTGGFDSIDFGDTAKTLPYRNPNPGRPKDPSGRNEAPWLRSKHPRDRRRSNVRQTRSS
jgi:hypothetical protein